MQAILATLIPTYPSFGEMLKFSVLGFGVVMIVLTLLSYFTGLIGKVFLAGESLKAKRAHKAAKTAPASAQTSSSDVHAFVVSAAIAAVLPELQAENSELVAVLAAACAASIEDEHRIISYKEVGDMSYARQGRWQLFASKNYTPKRVK